MSTYNITRSWRSGSEELSQTQSITANGDKRFDPVVPDETSDHEVDSGDVDQSDLKAVFIVSDQPVTVVTKSGGAGGTTVDTITLGANVPVDWTENDVASNPLTGDFDTILITNTGNSAAANVHVRLLESVA